MTKDSLNQNFQKCLEKTIDYLSRRDHSAKELRNKLTMKLFDKDLIEQVLIWVEERGYLRPPIELSKSLTEQLLRKGKGRHYIHQYLIKRGLPLPTENVESDLELQKALEIAKAAAKQKRRKGESLDRPAREKIGRKLISRGFPSDIVRRVIYQELKNEEDL